MVHLSRSTALYLATATFLGAVALPASLDFAARALGVSPFPSLAEDAVSTRTPLAEALGARSEPTSVRSVWMVETD